MFTIVGLGNPGVEYKDTRHNIGWIILDELLKKYELGTPTRSSMYAARVSEGMLHGVKVGVLFPMTFMNNSGASVSKYVKDKGSFDTLVVVHDEVDLAFGEVRISYDRGAGGHNGVRSIIDACGAKNFIRVRVGIAQKNFFGSIKRPTGDALSKFVLDTLKSSELKMLPEITERVDRGLELILLKGVEAAMQECN